MYSSLGHARMISDQVRMGAYAEALRRAVRPGSLVLDLGTGAGLFALQACRLGARRIYAIDPDDIIQVAREVAAANGYADRIEFFQDQSTRVMLPERADVIVSDLRGILPWLQDHIAAIADARRRFLAPGGTLIPCRDTLWAAPVEASELYPGPARVDDDGCNGFDLRPLWRLATNQWQKARVKPEQLLCESQRWATLDYYSVEDPGFSAPLTWTTSRAGTGHGFVVWFDSVLAEGVEFSNSPAAPEAIYGSAFFPWSEPVRLSAGDKISVQFEAHPVGDDYIWSWQTCVLSGEHSGTVRAGFRQSTFYGKALTVDSLRKWDADHVPSLDEQGYIDALILRLMDGSISLGEIARQVAERFPERFSKSEDALTRVGLLSLRYGR